MKKTSNYQLNQWDKEDRILMEDFNGDNAKIDAAIKKVDTRLTSEAAALRNRSGFVHIKSAYNNSNTTRFSLSVSDVQWEKYQFLWLEVYCTGGACMLRPNGANVGTCVPLGGYGTLPNGLASLSNGQYTQVLLFTGYRRDRALQALGLGNSCSAGNYYTTYAACSTLDVMPDFPDASRFVGPGSSMTLYGVI